MSSKPTVVAWRQTGNGYPSSWEAEDSDGMCLDIRFRNGELSIKRRASRDFSQMLNYDYLMLQYISEEVVDGVMSSELMRVLTSTALDWSLVQKVERGEQ